MNSLVSSILLILPYATLHVLALTKVACDLEDIDCVNEGVKTVHQNIVAGNPDIGMPTLEPVRVDLIEAVSPTLNYTLFDTYLHGMKACQPTKLQFMVQNLTWYHYLICPRLEVESKYYINGDIDTLHLEGEGKCKIIYDDYHIAIFGKAGKYEDSEGKVHFATKSFVLDYLDVQGGINYKFENLFYGDNEKSDAAHKTINKSWKKLDNSIQQPMMKLFFSKFVDNINIYVKGHNVREMFYRYV